MLMLPLLSRFPKFRFVYPLIFYDSDSDSYVSDSDSDLPLLFLEQLDVS